MKSYSKLLSVLMVLIGLPAFAAEAPNPTFSVFGYAPNVPLDYYNLIRNSPGQEFALGTTKCVTVDEGSGIYHDTLTLKIQAYDASTGTPKYQNPILISVNSVPWFSGQTSNCTDGQSNQAFTVGGGIAVSAGKRVIVVGMQWTAMPDDISDAVVKTFNAETGAELATLTFVDVDVDGYGLDKGKGSAVGNFINTKNDHLRVGYGRGNGGAIEYKVTYWDLLTGKQVPNAGFAGTQTEP